MRTPYHEGELAVQERAGVSAPARKVGAIVQETLPAVAINFLHMQRFGVLAGMDAAGHVWASPLAGAPGFLRATDERTVLIPSLPPGDPLAKNDGGSVGLLVIDLATRRRMRVNGDLERLPGGSYRLHVAQTYSNCPKYIQARDIEADTDERAEARPALHGNRLASAQQDLVRIADTFFIATRQPSGDADASHRGGNPGFVEVLDATTLRWPDFAGNNMFNTLGNLALDPRAGLLFVDFETGTVLQLTGTARILWEGTARRVEFTLAHTVETAAALPLRWEFREFSPFNPE